MRRVPALLVSGIAGGGQSGWSVYCTLLREHPLDNPTDTAILACGNHELGQAQAGKLLLAAVEGS